MTLTDLESNHAKRNKLFKLGLSFYSKQLKNNDCRYGNYAERAFSLENKLTDNALTALGVVLDNLDAAV